MSRLLPAAFSIVLCFVVGCDDSAPPAPPDPIDPTPTKPDEPQIDPDAGSARPTLPDTLANVAPRKADENNAAPSAGNTGAQQTEPQYTIAEQHKAIVQATVVAIRTNTAVLRTIVDADSARAAAPKLAAARKRMEQVSQEAQALGAVPRHANALLTTPLGQQVLEATNEMTAELARIDRDEALSESLRRAMAQVSQ